MYALMGGPYALIGGFPYALIGVLPIMAENCLTLVAPVHLKGPSMCLVKAPVCYMCPLESTMELQIGPQTVPNCANQSLPIEAVWHISIVKLLSGDSNGLGN